MQLCSELEREDDGFCTHFVKARSVSRDTIACTAAFCCSAAIAACSYQVKENREKGEGGGGQGGGRRGVRGRGGEREKGGVSCELHILLN